MAAFCYQPCERPGYRQVHAWAWLGRHEQRWLQRWSSKSGWWQSPVNVKEADWVFHRPILEKDCANMIVFDADEDGDADVISSSTPWLWNLVARTIARWRWEPRWHTHEISRLFSQSHGLIVADINDDGHPDLITGKTLSGAQWWWPRRGWCCCVVLVRIHSGKTPQWKPHLLMTAPVSVSALL